MYSESTAIVSRQGRDTLNREVRVQHGKTWSGLRGRANTPGSAEGREHCCFFLAPENSSSAGAKAAALLGSGQRVPTARWRRGPGTGSLRPGRRGRRGPFVSPRGRLRLVCPERAGGPRGATAGPTARLAPPTSQLQPGPPQLPVPPSPPGPKKRPCFLAFFGFGERGEGFDPAAAHRDEQSAGPRGTAKGDPRPPSCPEPEGTREARRKLPGEPPGWVGTLRGSQAAPPARSLVRQARDSLPLREAREWPAPVGSGRRAGSWGVRGPTHPGGSPGGGVGLGGA